MTLTLLPELDHVDEHRIHHTCIDTHAGVVILRITATVLLTATAFHTLLFFVGITVIVAGLRTSLATPKELRQVTDIIRHVLGGVHGVCSDHTTRVRR